MIIWLQISVSVIISSEKVSHVHFLKFFFFLLFLFLNFQVLLVHRFIDLRHKNIFNVLNSLKWNLLIFLFWRIETFLSNLSSNLTRNNFNECFKVRFHIKQSHFLFFLDFIELHLNLSWSNLGIYFSFLEFIFNRLDFV